jgi:hypothetical protein
MEKANTPVYFISVHTAENQSTADVSEDKKDSSKIEFGCSIEQLQDMVTKLKDAVKQVERSANAQ